MVAGKEIKVRWQIFNDFTRKEANAQVTQLNDINMWIPQGNILTPKNVSVNVTKDYEFHSDFFRKKDSYTIGF
jgi:hypothetical protein